MYIPKPTVVQQTWGNDIARAIQQERMMNHNKEIMDQELEYKKTRDTVQDERWNKEFDVKKVTAKTQNDILQQQLMRATKNNEMYASQVDEMLTAQKTKSAFDGLRADEAQNVFKKKEIDRDIALQRQKASRWWGGKEDTVALNQEARQAGLKDSWGSAGDAVYDFFDHNFTGVNDYQGLGRARQEADPSYQSSEQLRSDVVNQLGTLPDWAYGQVTGQDWGSANKIATMNNQQAINYVNQGMPNPVQQMYQNQQPVQMMQPQQQPVQQQQVQQQAAADPSIWQQGRNLGYGMAKQMYMPWYLRGMV